MYFYATWVTLCLIGVSDAREHRIPNQLLLALLVITTLEVLFTPLFDEWLEVFTDKATSFVLCFTVGLLLHFMRVMAAGDVKLIAVLGFLLGLEPLTDYLFYTCVSTAFVGSMYWALNKLPSNLGDKNRGDFSLLSVSAVAYVGGEKIKHAVTTQQGLTYMPFAPVLIIGLAMYHYFSY
ncbi:A24 family peptidase [Vibrio japonicus]|uniref:A24 family peptidase n=1 Tax=Vibrio japonicus TaxID=1824638 RepID=A0ABY5LH45_9VIBR|nr:A24 family peptidase [Vibrio japonicus]UUM30082.1 A24 family peptidase [Vibrio japonicus]